MQISLKQQLKKAQNIVFHIFYKYYHIFAHMNIIKRNIPNFITLANLACGLLSIISAFQGDFKNGTLFIFLGVFFDFFDGLTARLLKLNSEFGKQLDSIADIVTFGVAPGFIFFHFMFYLDNDVILRYSSQENILFYPASITPI